MPVVPVLCHVGTTMLLHVHNVRHWCSTHGLHSHCGLCTGTRLVPHWALHLYCTGAALGLRWSGFWYRREGALVQQRCCTGTALVLLFALLGWYNTGAGLVLQWCCPPTPLVLPWFVTGMAQVLRRYCIGSEPAFDWHCTRAILVLRSYCVCAAIALVMLMHWYFTDTSLLLC